LPEKKFQDLLQGILRDDTAEPSHYRTRVQTFEEAGVLIKDRGLVMTMSDVPSIQSLSRRVGEPKRARGDPEELRPSGVLSDVVDAPGFA
jgi:hypothetical protein